VQFAGLNMPGDSYQFQAPQIRLLPLPRLSESTLGTVESIERLSQSIVANRKNGVAIDDEIMSANIEAVEKLVETLYLTTNI
jgi:hypothetical protein